MELAFQRLGQLVIAVGQLLAAHCDAYVAQKSGTKAAGRLQQIISDSLCPKVSKGLHRFLKLGVNCSGQRYAASQDLPDANGLHCAGAAAALLPDSSEWRAVGLVRMAYGPWLPHR